jgi:hypothetical protein
MLHHTRGCEGRTYGRNPRRTLREGDYEFARTRFSRKDGRRLERGYEVASHFTEAIKARRRDGGAGGQDAATLEQEFREYARLWWQETRVLSSIQAKIFNPHYQRIIGMGRAVLPFIFSELRDRGGQWYWALECIVGQNPAAHAETLPEAKHIWLEYARANNYL